MMRRQAPEGKTMSVRMEESCSGVSGDGGGESCAWRVLSFDEARFALVLALAEVEDETRV